jgi:hypothetical protein
VIGGGSAATVEGIMAARQAHATRRTAQNDAFMIREGNQINMEAVSLNRALPNVVGNNRSTPNLMQYQRGAVGDLSKLEMRVPRLAAPEMHDHHLMPRQFKGFFSRRGIDIDAHTVSLGEKSHLIGVHGKGLGSMPGGWNREWAKWIAENPNATPKDIYQQLGIMMDRYQINDLPIHSFRK